MPASDVCGRASKINAVKVIARNFFIEKILSFFTGCIKYEKNGGERGIRTLETVSRLHAFPNACAFNHSATSP